MLRPQLWSSGPRGAVASSIGCRNQPSRQSREFGTTRQLTIPSPSARHNVVLDHCRDEREAGAEGSFRGPHEGAHDRVAQGARHAHLHFDAAGEEPEGAGFPDGARKVLYGRALQGPRRVRCPPQVTPLCQTRQQARPVHHERPDEVPDASRGPQAEALVDLCRLRVLGRYLYLLAARRKICVLVRRHRREEPIPTSLTKFPRRGRSTAAMASGNAGGDPASAGTRKAAHHYERYPLGKPFKFNTVLVHGATSGLGYALAEAFLVAPTTKVIVTGRRQERLDEMTSKYGDRVRAYPLDGSRLAELGPWCKKVVEENPDLNAVILNAGLQRQTNFLDPSSISLDELDAEVDTNYTSFLHMIVHFLPHLQGLAKAGTDSYLAVVTSGLALVPLPACANYCATKAALHHLILAIREQLSDPFPNLHVIEILPPLVASELHDHKHQPTLAFDKMSAEDRGKLAEMPVDEFVASVFAGFAKGERDIAVGNTAASFEKLEVGTRFKLLELMRPRYKAFMERFLGLPSDRADQE